MTIVTTDAGICGFSVTIKVMCLSSRHVGVRIDTECEMVMQMSRQIEEIDWRHALGNWEKSLVYAAAMQHINHPACPVPAAILKAIEVEVGLALPKDVTIHFKTAN